MLELKNICVSFRRERQDKIFGHTRQQVLFDVSLHVKNENRIKELNSIMNTVLDNIPVYLFDYSIRRNALYPFTASYTSALLDTS